MKPPSSAMASPSSAIHAVFIADAAYAVPTAVAIRSLRDSRAADTRLVVHVLGRGLSSADRAVLLGLADARMEVEVRDAGSDEVLDGLSGADGHVSSAALRKFRLAETFPGLDRILYLDGDILVRKDLSALWNTDLAGAYLAAVPDFKLAGQGMYERLGFRFRRSLASGLRLLAGGGGLRGVGQKIRRRWELRRRTYFNSGVMLLDLARWRADGVAEKLVAYKLHGKNFFMDQDALNVVLGGKVRWLPAAFNFETYLLDRARLPAIRKFYRNPSLSLERLVSEAAVVHFHAWCKPWLCYNVPGAAGWKAVHDEVFPGRPLPRKMLPLAEKRKRFPDAEAFGEPPPPRPGVVVSLTSHPARVEFAAAAIRSVLAGTVLPDQIELWLGRDRFPGGEAELPEELRALCAASGGKVAVCWAEEDLGPATKLLYARKAHPGEAVVTVDDDHVYPATMLETLLVSFAAFPAAVSACRTHLMVVSGGKILPYSEWPQDVAGLTDTPSHQLLATGVGGVLYPPRLLPDRLFDTATMRRLSPRNDDLWFKAVELLDGVPVVQAGEIPPLRPQPGSRRTALANANVLARGNDGQLRALLDWAVRTSGRTEEELISQGGLASVLSLEELNAFYRAALPGFRAMLRRRRAPGPRLDAKAGGT